MHEIVKHYFTLGKALPACAINSDNQAMLTDKTATVIAQRLQQYLQESGVRQSAIAAACDVSKQAVQGWKNTGRIDKRKLAALAQFSGRPIEWWLSDTTEPVSTVAKEDADTYQSKVSTLADPLIKEAADILNSLTQERRREAVVMLRGFAAAVQREVSDSANPRVSNA